jgi:hypothetical protein
MTMARVTTRLFLLALIVGAALLAGAAYWRGRNTCVEPGSGLRGEVKVRPDGTTLYFDGQCWSTQPLPPLDMPL